jgi:hypothetical protein
MSGQGFGESKPIADNRTKEDAPGIAGLRSKSIDESLEGRNNADAM